MMESNVTQLNTTLTLQATPPNEWCTFASVCCIVFIALGTTGNLLTILALARSPRLRNANTAFVINLAVADLLFCVVNLPPTASRYIHQQWIFGEQWCELFPFFFYGNVAASILSMTCITLNRYIMIIHNHVYASIFKRKYIVAMVAFCWLFSFAILLPTLLKAWGQFGLNERTFSCTILNLDGRSPKKFLFFFGFLFPCLTIFISYSCIFYKVRRTKRALNVHSTNSADKRSRDKEMRVTKIMVISFSSFVLCFFPLMVVNLLEGTNKADPVLHLLASILAWMSSCLNPVIYVALNKQYRKAFIDLLLLGISKVMQSTSSGSYSCKQPVKKTSVEGLTCRVQESQNNGGNSTLETRGSAPLSHSVETLPEL